MIYSPYAVEMLIGCISNDTSLLLDEKYPLDLDKEGDFGGIKKFESDKEQEEGMILFHRIVISAIYNLTLNGTKIIEIIDIDKYIKNKWEAYYNIFEKFDGMNFINTVKEIANKENYHLYYDIIKKLSTIRYFERKNYEISPFWDINKTDEENHGKLDDYSCDDIIDYYDKDIVGARKNFSIRNKNVEETHAGMNFEETKKMLQEEPFYGHSFCSEYLNSITRGMLDKSLTCFSSPTGTGKSTIAIATICKVCARELWDYDKHEFVINKSQTKNGSLMIQFELDNELQIIPKFIANISGIPTDVILDGKYTEEQNERIDRANEILKNSNIHIVYLPNFTMKSIENIVKEYVLKYKIDFFVYDYLQEGASLNAEMNSTNGGIGLRTDQVLTNLSSFLKDISNKYNLSTYTMSQTNSNLGNFETLGQECIAGSRGVANKVDIGGILLPLRPKEEKIRDIIEQELKLQNKLNGFGLPHANYCFHMYKVRFGKFAQNIKIWVDISLGTGRIRDCFVTDWRDRLITVKGKKLERENKI